MLVKVPTLADSTIPGGRALLLLLLALGAFSSRAHAGWSTPGASPPVLVAAVLGSSAGAPARVFAWNFRDARASFESTDDDGLTWQVRSLQPASSGYPYWIGSAPAADGTPGSAVLYASVVTAVETARCDFLRSVDRGATWLKLSSVSACSFAIDPSDPSVIYGVDLNGFSIFGPLFSEKSTDGGSSWRSLTPISGWNARVAADGTVYVPAGCSLARSRNKGVTWTQLEGWPNAGRPSECTYAYDLLPVRHPVHGDAYLIAATNDGLYESADRGATFRPMGLRAFAIRKLALAGYRADGGPDVLFSYAGGVGVARIGANYNLLWPLQANLPPGIQADGVAPGRYAYGSSGLSICRNVDDCIGGTLPAFAEAVEFHNTILGHYFVTADPAEVSAIDRGAAGPGWNRTGASFPVYRDAIGSEDTIAAVCRFVREPAAGTPSHFYALDDVASECPTLAADTSWRLESDRSFFAYRAAGGELTAAQLAGACGIRRGLFRLYNRRSGLYDGNHRYTTDPALYDRMIAEGWIGEGVRMCVPRPSR